jgi:TIR domain
VEIESGLYSRYVWKGSEMNFLHQVFISYASEDREYAARLHEDLKMRSIDSWFDRESLLPGQQWRSQIKNAIEQSRYFLALLSEQSVTKRGYIQKELRRALDLLDEYPESAIYLIPARLQSCQPDHVRLKDLQWVDLFPSWKDGVDKIVAAVGGPNNQTDRTGETPGTQDWLTAAVVGPENALAVLIRVAGTLTNFEGLTRQESTDRIQNSVSEVIDRLRSRDSTPYQAKDTRVEVCIANVTADVLDREMARFQSNVSASPEEPLDVFKKLIATLERKQQGGST